MITYVYPPPDASVVIRPPLAAWPDLARRALAARSPADAARAATFRAELGLPAAAPLAITGHQAQFWHPGILAKYLALACHRLPADASPFLPIHLIVDQDDNDPWSIRYPVMKLSGTLEARTWRADGRTGPRSDSDMHIPVARRPAITPAPLPTLAPGERFAAPHVARGLESIRAALAAHAAVPSAAAQVAAALTDLLHPLAAAPNATLLATAISRTTLFAETIDHMRADPRACARAYNAAVAKHPHARIAPLAAADTDSPELPLWHIPAAPNSPRRRVNAAALARIPTIELAPRALLMTGLLRWAGCDLFVHGTGGGGTQIAADHDAGYDAITDSWLGDWLGASLAPIAVVTATLCLTIDAEPITPADIARAKWLLHRAAHDPALLDDPAAARAKHNLLSAIQTARATGHDPSIPYRQMHALLETTRRTHADRLAALRADGNTAAARRADAAILTDRTWAFSLYEPSQIEALKARVAASGVPGASV